MIGTLLGRRLAWLARLVAPAWLAAALALAGPAAAAVDAGDGARPQQSRAATSTATPVAATASTPATSPRASALRAPSLVVYARDGCPHCADAKAYLALLQLQRPALRIEWRDVARDAQAARALEQVFADAGQWPPGVPTFVLGPALWIGFDDAQHSGRSIEAMLDAAGIREPGRDKDAAAGPAGAASAHAGTSASADASRAPGEIRTRWFGTLSAATLGLPLFTLAIGLLDGFNPCAMWVLLFLLSLLVRLQDRRRIVLVAGSFVLASGAVYYAFMAAWLNVFLLVGWSDALRWTLAALALAIGAINAKDAFVPDHGPSLRIPASARPSLVARMHRAVHAPGLATMLAGVAALALVVNTVELLCTAGLPALYTAVLAQQGVGPAARYGWLLLYILAYMADDALMVGTAVLALGRGKLTERAGRVLKGASGVVMLALGAVLMWRPQWLV
ncbi:MAG: glutaredoxin family protein [Burkholderiales bacterium]|nr:glutaredoxin family protein [Burkholderiales bacterium]